MKLTVRLAGGFVILAIGLLLALLLGIAAVSTTCDSVSQIQFPLSSQQQLEQLIHEESNNATVIWSASEKLIRDTASQYMTQSGITPFSRAIFRCTSEDCELTRTIIEGAIAPSSRFCEIGAFQQLTVRYTIDLQHGQVDVETNYFNTVEQYFAPNIGEVSPSIEEVLDSALNDIPPSLWQTHSSLDIKIWLYYASWHLIVYDSMEPTAPVLQFDINLYE